MPMSYPVNPEREYKTGGPGMGVDSNTRFFSQKNSKIARSPIFFLGQSKDPPKVGKESRLKKKHFAFNRDR